MAKGDKMASFLIKLKQSAENPLGSNLILSSGISSAARTTACAGGCSERDSNSYFWALL
jgi:hypothetical protein